MVDLCRGIAVGARSSVESEGRRERLATGYPSARSSLAYGFMYRLGRMALLGFVLVGLLLVLRSSVGGTARAPERMRGPETTYLKRSPRSVGASGRWFAGSRFVARQIDTLEEASRLVVRLTNQRREAHGRRPIRPDSGLTRVACAHTRDMLLRDFVGHENPDGEGPTDRVARLHRRLIGSVAENLWARTGQAPDRNRPKPLAEHIVEGWMNSPPHRSTLLDSSATHLGVCVGWEGTRIRATQIVATVRAYLEEPLPYRVESGDEIAVSVPSTTGRGVKRYDFAWSDTDRRALGPFSYDDTLRVPFEEGRYRIRFYLPENEVYRELKGVYRGYRGPEIQVVSPS